ncbi:MAG: hypothetical protein VX188_03420 [Candidatus Thermoplasmatota archaeon]|nr:hypothetical protein [Candidatus Thermoplasmatota archaeon]
MAKMDFECPKCKELNRIIILGNDSGRFTRTCVNCDSELEIEMAEGEEELQAVLTTDRTDTNRAKTVPEDYKKYKGRGLAKNSQTKTMVTVISVLIFSSALMGFITGGLLRDLPDEHSGYEEINVEIVVKNNTSTLENATITVNSHEAKQTYAGKGKYLVFLKPGKYQIGVSVDLHKNSTMSVYVPPQEDNLSLVDIEQGIEGINRFTFYMKEGSGNEELDDSVYIKISKWCPSLIFIFSLIGIWGAWITYTLQSYKYAQIGAFFSILAMGFFVVGPILGFIALLLLPKIKNMFNRSF